MGFAVYHGSKGKASGGGVGNHIDRKKGMEHTYSHADPERLHLNKSLLPVDHPYASKKLPEAINERIEKGYTGKRKPRADAVKYISHVLTGSHEDMKRIFSDQEKSKSWLQENYNFLNREYGKENIVRFVLHLDERTPHLHAITVPLTEDGRLSAKEVYGNKSALSARQDRYAEAMHQFGLQRGLKRTGIKHENAKDYYSRISEAQRNAEKEVGEPSKNILGVYKENSVQEMRNALKSANLALVDLTEKYKQEQIKSESKSKSEQRALIFVREKKKEVLQLQENATEFQKKAIAIIKDPKQSEIVRNKIISDEKLKEQEKNRNRGRGMGY